MVQPNSPNALKSPPRRPKSLEPKQLGFIRQGMVSWFDPIQLIQTAIRSLVSSTFGSYSDKRELMPALSAEAPCFDYTGKADGNGDFWLDYLADTGDGFDSTYTMASLAGAPTLKLTGVKDPLHRGQILVLGGDGVYPTASRDEYFNRFVGPFRSALPYVAEESSAPHLFAVPGNHDWYDGLTSFLRLFSQGRWIGGWKTLQKRSYFALALPHGWWLWGTDIQLDSDVDHPQLLFFQDLAKKMALGDKVILCTAEPTWTHEWQGHKNGFKTLAFFEEKVLRSYGHEPVLVLSGDLHNYHRYFRNDSKMQRITAGGGGAFLHATHYLPKTAGLLEGELAVDDPEEFDPTLAETEIQESSKVLNLLDEKGKTRYTFGGAFPDHETSLNLSNGVRRAFLRKRSGPRKQPLWDTVRQSWGLALFLSAYYLVGAWLVQSASKKDGLTLVQQMYKFLDQAEPANSLSEFFNCMVAFGYIARLMFYLTLNNPVLVVWAVILVGGLTGYCSATGFKKFWIGGRHALSHLLASAGLFMLIIAFNHFIDAHTGIKLPVNKTLHGDVNVVPIKFALLFNLEMLVGGFFAAAFLFGNYLYRYQAIHLDHTFSAMGIEDWKNYLKLRFTADGGLTVYPVGVKKVCSQWKTNENGSSEASFIIPETGNIDAVAHLIEGPLVYDAKARKWI